MSDCILDSAARIAAVSIPNCPFAWVGRIARTPSTTTDAFNRVGRYQGRTELVPSSKGAGFGGSSGSWSLRRQKNDLRRLFGFFLGSVIDSSLSRGQGSGNQTVYSTGRGCSAFHKNVVVCNAACLLTQFRRKHLLHVRLASEIGDLCLGGQERIRPGCAHCNLVFHLIGGLKNDIRALIGDHGCFEILLP